MDITKLFENNEINKSFINQVIDDLKIEFDNDSSQILNTALKVKFIEEVFKGIKEKLREKVLNELYKYNSKEQITLYGSKFQIKESGTKYDYLSCNDHYYNEIISEINRLNELRSHREAFLQSLNKPINYVDEDSGEVFEITPPIKTSTTTYQINLKTK